MTICHNPWRRESHRHPRIHQHSAIDAGDTVTRRIASMVAGWQIAIRTELDRSLIETVEGFNREDKLITSARDLAVAIDPGNGLVEHYVEHPEEMAESGAAMVRTINGSHTVEFDAFFDPPTAAPEAED